MSIYASNVTVGDAARMLLDADRIAITTHAKPDGDAFGSVVALAAALRELGKDAAGYLMPPVPNVFSRLNADHLVSHYDPAVGLGQPDMVVVVDTGAWAQVPPLKNELTGLLNRTLIIDHHQAGDIAAAWRYVDPKAAACCELIAACIDAVAAASGRSIELLTPTVCDALYVGLTSDTGWFRFPNTRPRTHELAAQLLQRGVDHARLYTLLEQTERPQKLALQVRALQGMTLLDEGAVALMVLRARDFTETGALLEETERFVEMPQSVATVQLVALITEPAPDASSRKSPNGAAPGIRLSFRSKHGPHAVDVSKLAQQFGGGGHARAAGARVAEPIEAVIDRVKAAASQAVAAARSGSPAVV